MIETIKRRKWLLLIFAVFLAIALVMVVLLFIRRPRTPDAFVTGEAEAVATTQPIILNGIWEPTRFLDELYYPIGIAMLGDYLVVADSMCDRIQILTNCTNVRIGRPGQFGFSYVESGAFIDGYREHALFSKPAGVFVCQAGEIIVADSGNHVIRRITEEHVITIAGNGFPGFADGREGTAQFNRPRAAVKRTDGYIYVADTMNHVLRLVSPRGEVTLLAGAPGVGEFADGALTDARFFEPSGLYLTADGVLYIADAGNHAIRRMENGTITTIAGEPGEINRFTGYHEGGYTDGPNDIARFNFPRDIALLPNGYILVADSLNHSIRLITPTATRTLVGGGRADSFALSVENLSLSRPEGIATDGENIFISDSTNNRVISVPLTPRVMTGRLSRYDMLAGTGVSTRSRFAYRGDIRVFVGDERVNFGRVHPWITAEAIYIPIRPFLEALGARVELDERTNRLSIYIADTVTILERGSDYFILRGVMVTTMDEMMRLFPYTLEWFPDLSLIALDIPADLR